MSTTKIVIGVAILFYFGLTIGTWLPALGRML